eukprot:CAMPEP_0175259618 /NCGR_PEP_ID=MMETSP0093-20121207/39829_1 /TAXON_ID=311494 /ORGANISM="Alexandrium monilatum, Strain CCMP3105" /LENGTH=46 /DNA_ID= /DNA_START= /DNA_END= /DNA_ORIENTATION=
MAKEGVKVKQGIVTFSVVLGPGAGVGGEVAAVDVHPAEAVADAGVR